MRAASGHAPDYAGTPGRGASGRGDALASRALGRVDAVFERLYGSPYNPLYRSGTIAVVLLVVLLVTGLYLLLFYRIGSPHESVARMTGDPWLGAPMRTVHRYAADAALVAVAIHAFRMFAQRRTWGPRALAWLSGLALLFILFVCGWTGYVMVWDVQAQLLAVEGARFLDVLPFFSEPIGRAFVGEAPVPAAFFFLNLFLHIALPIGMGLLLWIHVSRIARPALLPSRGLSWGLVGVLVGLAVLWPAPLGSRAELLRVPGQGPLDVFYSFWLPITRALPAGAVWLGGAALGGVVLLTPWWARPKPATRPAPSRIDERLCTGCEQCSLDCPYEAIRMVPREDGRGELLAVVDPALCVSCGICAGSCAPMGSGPPGRSGRDQLAAVRAFVSGRSFTGAEVAVIGCGYGATGAGAGPAAQFARGTGEVIPLGSAGELDGSPLFGIDCAGSLHTSVIEVLVRAGVGGVLIAACPERDCRNREGPKWLAERLYHDREAELKARVDRRRVMLVHAGSGESGRLRSALETFRLRVAELGAGSVEREIAPDLECEPARVGGGAA